jgi:hypothetical protein
MAKTQYGSDNKTINLKLQDEHAGSDIVHWWSTICILRKSGILSTARSHTNPRAVRWLTRPTQTPSCAVAHSPYTNPRAVRWLTRPTQTPELCGGSRAPTQNPELLRPIWWSTRRQSGSAHKRAFLLFFMLCLFWQQFPESLLWRCSSWQ